jgi:hypothetical protein
VETRLHSCIVTLLRRCGGTAGRRGIRHFACSCYQHFERWAVKAHRPYILRMVNLRISTSGGEILLRKNVLKFGGWHGISWMM